MRQGANVETLFVHVAVFINLFSCRFGLVEYRTVEEAKAVFDKPSTIELDGCVLFIDYGKIDQQGNLL